jgi:hypothetical protein
MLWFWTADNCFCASPRNKRLPVFFELSLNVVSVVSRLLVLVRRLWIAFELGLFEFFRYRMACAALFPPKFFPTPNYCGNTRSLSKWVSKISVTIWVDFRLARRLLKY